MLESLKKLLIFTRIRCLNLGVVFLKKNYIQYSVLSLLTKKRIKILISIINLIFISIINLIAIYCLKVHFKIKSLYHLQYNFQNYKILKTFQSCREGGGGRPAQKLSVPSPSGYSNEIRFVLILNFIFQLQSKISFTKQFFTFHLINGVNCEK